MLAGAADAVAPSGVAADDAITIRPVAVEGLGSRFRCPPASRSAQASRCGSSSPPCRIPARASHDRVPRRAFRRSGQAEREVAWRVAETDFAVVAPAGTRFDLAEAQL